jgi:hypothetical protein
VQTTRPMLARAPIDFLIGSPPYGIFKRFCYFQELTARAR